jgi:hypothetical protein
METSCREISVAYLVVGMGQASSLRQLRADPVHATSGKLEAVEKLKAVASQNMRSNKQ